MHNPSARTRTLAALGTFATIAVSLSIYGCGGNTDPGDTGFTSNGGHGTESTSHGGSGQGGEAGSNPFATTGTHASGSGSAAGGGDNCSPTLPVTIRDFSPKTQPDFEYHIMDDLGIVATDLGADDKPVYAGNPTTPTTHGKMDFDEWYNDTKDVNVNIPFKITLTKGAGGVYTYDNQAYFPIDGKGLGNEGNAHNFHFTSEVHTRFEYKGGEVFTFTGDDDLWTFVNKKLAINLGGIHGAETASVDLDAQAAALGIEKGKTYALDVFGAERHTTQSHFRIDTTIGCFKPPIPK